MEDVGKFRVSVHAGRALERVAQKKSKERESYDQQLAAQKLASEERSGWDYCFSDLAQALRWFVRREDEGKEEAKNGVLGSMLDIGSLIREENSLPGDEEFRECHATAIEKLERTDGSAADCYEKLRRADFPEIVAMLDLIAVALTGDIQQLDDGIDVFAEVAASSSADLPFEAQYEIQGDLRQNPHHKGFKMAISGKMKRDLTTDQYRAAEADWKPRRFEDVESQLENVDRLVEAILLGKAGTSKVKSLLRPLQTSRDRRTGRGLIVGWYNWFSLFPEHQSLAEDLGEMAATLTRLQTDKGDAKDAADQLRLQKDRIHREMVKFFHGTVRATETPAGIEPPVVILKPTPETQIPESDNNAISQEEELHGKWSKFSGRPGRQTINRFVSFLIEKEQVPEFITHPLRQRDKADPTKIEAEVKKAFNRLRKRAKSKKSEELAGIL